MTSTARDRLLAAGVATIAALLLLPGLGNLDLWAPDEPRYVEIADEVARGDGVARWFVLELNGEAYTQKPPLYYWLAAWPGLATGRVSAGEARLPSAIAGIAAATMTFWLGLRLFASPIAGLYASGILLTSFRFAHLARRAQLDVLLTAFETLALLAFVRQESGIGSKKANVAVFHAAMGAAVLTKGPVGLLPLIVILVVLSVERRGALWRDWLPAWGLALSLGPACLWLAAAVSLTPPGFFESAVIENLFDRFANGTSHPRPFYYYLIQFPADFMPWTLVWPAAAMALAHSWKKNASTESYGWRVVAIWLGVFFVFFSLSAEKRGLYLLPAFPAAALLCGAGLDRALARRDPLSSRIQAAFVFGLIALSLAGGLLALAPPLQWIPGFALPSELGAAIAGISFATLLFGVAWARGPNAARRQMALALAWVLAVEVSLFHIGYPALDATKSPRKIAQTANRLAGPEGRIGLFRESALLGGLLYYGRLYGNRPIVLLEHPEEVTAFTEAGGRLIVAREHNLGEAPGVVQRETMRNGHRALAFAIPAHGETP